MTYAEKRYIKEFSLKKNVRQRLEKAKYEFFKEIEGRGGIFENAGDKQERELREFKSSLHSLSINSDLRNQIIDEINSFIDFMYRYGGTDEQVLKEAHKVITRYEKRQGLNVA